MRRKAHKGSEKFRRTFRQRNVKFALGITVLFVLGFVASGAFGQVMETVTDKCEDAANLIESIIIKYA